MNDLFNAGAPENPRATIGGNNPPVDPPPVDPPPAQTALAKAILATKAARDWLTAHPKITTKAESEEAQLHINALRSAWKEADDERKALNKPFDDKIKANNSTFRGPLEACEANGDKVKRLNGEWLKAEQARIEAERAEAARKQREAEEQERKARAEAAAAAAKGDTDKAAEAAKAAEAHQEQALKSAYYAKPQKAAVKAAGSGRSMTMRDYWSAKLTDPERAIAHYLRYPAMRQAMAEAALKLAIQDAQSFKDKAMAGPGVEFTVDSRPV